MRKSAERCIFCAPESCSCNSRKSSKRALSNIKTQPDSVIIKGNDASVTKAPRQGLSGTVHLDADELELRRALTILCTSGLVSSQSIIENEHYLNLTESEKRKLIWKQKRAENA